MTVIDKQKARTNERQVSPFFITRLLPKKFKIVMHMRFLQYCTKSHASTDELVTRINKLARVLQAIF
jgi:hypothetical protein